MKNFSAYIVKLIFIAFVITLFSCEKVPFDYRNQYIGDWKFSVSSSNFNNGDGTYSFSDYEYCGKVKYGEEKDELEIHYGDGLFYTVELDKESKSVSPSSVHFNMVFDGTSSLTIRTSWGGRGGGGSGVTTGVKM